MNFLDMIKNSVLERLDGSLSLLHILLALIFSLLAGIFILFIYKKTTQKVAVGRSFMITLLLMCAITATMVLTITSNLALSLGMVGALSIVRFRTAVKDPADTAFLFWAVAAGITAGAGFTALEYVLLKISRDEETRTRDCAAGVQVETRLRQELRLADEPSGVARRNPVRAVVLGVAVARQDAETSVETLVHLADVPLVEQVVGVEDEEGVVALRRALERHLVE